MNVNPYLSFEGRCEEAIEFYKAALGAKVEMMLRFEESPDKTPGMCAAGSEKKIMHSSLRIGDSVIMASDGRCAGQTNFHGIAMSLSVKTAAEAQKCFAALSEGGTVQMPITKTFFSPSFGMAQDKFGVGWMVMALQIP